MPATVKKCIMIKKILTYRTGFLLKAMLCLSLFLIMGTTGVMAQFAISEDFRGSGNPDIIIGGPGGTEGTAVLTSGTNDPLNAGWLRLTRAADYQKGYAYVNKSFPSTLGVLVDFEYKMWRDANDSNGGADGIGVFLFDATSSFQLGGYGGSLGYAPNTTAPAVPGLAGGYVGVGLDAYGNYSNQSEGRRGGPGETPNAIVLRGPTTTDPLTTNRYLTGVGLGDRTGTNNNIRSRDEIDFNTWQTTRPTDAQFYRRVQIEITRLDAAGIYYNIKVRWKKSPTAAFTQIIDYTTTDVPPALLKLGFAASTGASRNFHEIRNLLVTTPGNLRVVKRADKDIIRTIDGSNEITYTIEVTNDTAFDIPGIAFTDRITDSYGNLIAEGTSGFNVTSITATGFLSAALPTAASLTTNEITGNLVLAANTTGTITIKGNLTMLPDGSILQNMASAIPGLDEDLNNNTSIVRTPVTAENVDLMLVKTVADQCINSGTASTFTVRVYNNGITGTSFRRLGYIGTRVAFSVVVPPGYTYNDITTGGLIGSDTDNANNNVTSRWSRKELLNIPSTGYKTYVYVARGTDPNGAAQTLAAGSFYDYPVTYTMLPPVGTISYTDTSTARLFTDYDYLGSIETAANQLNNNASIQMYMKPVAPTVSPTPLNYCVGDNAAELTATKTNSAYTLRWYLTAGGFSSEFPITPDTSVKGTYTYYVSQVNGDCEGPTAPITIVVGPTNTGSIQQPGNFCWGSNVTITGTAVAATPAPTYSWQSAVEGGAWTTISGATSQDYTINSVSQTLYYRRLVTINGCTAPSDIIVRIFVPSPGVIGNSQNRCANGNWNGIQPFSNVTSGTNGTIDGVTYAYQWQSSANGTTGWTDVSGTNATYTPPDPGNNSIRYYRRLVRYTYTVAGVTTTCNAISNVVAISKGSSTGYAPSQGGIQSDQSICYGATPATITSSQNAGSGGYYQWEKSTTSASAGFQVIPDASPTSGTYSPGPLTQSTWYRRTKVNGCDVFLTGNPPVGPVVAITVLNPTPATIGSSQTICYNTLPGLLSASVAGAGTQYRWEMADGTSGESWSTAPGTSDAATYQSPTPLTSTKRFRRINRQTSGGVTCESMPSNVVTITVKAETNPGVISSSQTICYNTQPATLTATAASGDTGAGTGSITYQWQRSTTDTNPASFSNIAGETNASYSPPILTATTHYRRLATVSRGTSAVPGETACATATAAVTITVHPSLNAGGITSSAATICYGSTVSFTSTPNATATPGTTGAVTSYRWEVSNSATGPWSIAPGSTNTATFTSGTLTSNTYFRRVFVSTLNGVSCETATTPATLVTVRAEITPGQIGPDQTICYNTQPAVIGSIAPASDGSGTMIYAWQSNSGSGWSTDIPGPAAAGPTYQPGNLTVTTQFRRFAISSNGNCRSLSAATVTITVQTTPTQASITAPSPSTVCSGSNITIGSGGVGTGAGNISYRWESSAVSPVSYSIIPGQTGETLTVNGITASTMYRRYTVSTLNNVECLSPATTAVTITVPNLVAGTIVSNQVICAGSSMTVALASAPGGDGSGGTYKWQSSSSGDPNGWWDDINVSTSSYLPTAPVNSTLYYRRVIMSTTNGVSCQAASNIVRVAPTNPQGAGNVVSYNPICYGSTVTILSTSDASFSEPGATLTYAWQSNSGSGWSADIPGATGPSYTTGVITQNTNFRRYPIATYGPNSCRSSNYTEAQVVVMPNATGGSIQTTGGATNLDICSGTTPPPITNVANGTDANQGYVWQYSTATIPWTDLGGITSSTSYTPASPITETTYYRRVGVSNNGIICRGTTTSNVVTMNVVTSPAGGTAGNNQTICNGSTPATLTVTGGAAGTYRWEMRTNPSGTWSTVTPAAAATGQDYSPGPLTQTTYYRRVILAGACASDGYSSTVTITVTPVVNGGTANSNQNICNGGATSTLTVTGADSGTYRWEFSTVSATGPWNPAGSTSTSFNPGTLNATTYYRRATIIGSCEGYSTAVTITVSAAVTQGSISGTQTICMDTAPTILGSATVGLGGGSGTITYRWESSVNGTSGWTTIASATGPTYQPPVLHSTRYYRRITISTSTVDGNTATCESAATTPVTVTTKNCKVITNPMVRSRVN